MFVKLLKGIQKQLISRAIRKAGSERKLSKMIGIPKSTIYEYKYERMNLPLERFEKLLSFLGLSIKKYKIEYLLENWGRVKGGVNCVKNKILNGTLKSNLEKARKKTKGIKSWHVKMRRKDPVKYHLIQYEHFKKIGGYKYKTLRGELVRNSLEKEIADFLYLNGLNYSYEKLIKGSKNYYFPDFEVNSIIIECTMWKGFEKAYKLRDKIKDLQSIGIKVYVFVPSNLRSFYKVIDSYLISSLEELKTKLSPGSSVSI